MRDFNTLTRTAEIHSMVANDIPTPYNGKTDRTVFTWASMARAGPGCDVVERFAPRIGNDLPHLECRTRGRIDLVFVMRLKHLNVITRIQDACSHV